MIALVLAAACAKEAPRADSTVALPAPDTVKAAATPGPADSTTILGRDSVRKGPIIALPVDSIRKPL